MTKKVPKFLTALLIFSICILPKISFGQTVSAPVITTEVSNITATSANISVTVEKFDPSLFPMKLSLVWNKVGGTPQVISLNTQNLNPTDIPTTLKAVVLDNLDPSTDTTDSSYSYRVVQLGTNAPYTAISTFKTLVVATTSNTAPLTVTVSGATGTSDTSTNLHGTINIVAGGSEDISDFNENFQIIDDEHYQIGAFNDENYVTDVLATIPSDQVTSGFNKTASAIIAGLEPNTLYHYRLKIEVYNHQIIISNETTFTTAKSFVPISNTNNNPNSNNSSNSNSISPQSNTTPASLSTSTNKPSVNKNLIPCGTIDNPTPCGGSQGWNQLMTLINNVINFILFRLALPIAAIMFAYAGFELLTAGGDTSKMKKAKSIFLNVALGLVFAVAAWLIVDTVLTILGYHGSWIGFK